MYFASGRRRRQLRELQRIAPEIGKLHHLIALVVMPQDDQARPQLGFRAGDALLELLLGKRHVELR